MSLLEVRKALNSLSSPAHAVILQRFFKTGPGEYGEGDIFMGLRVPQIRSVAKAHPNISLKDTHVLLSSPLHEERLTALLILLNQFNKAPLQKKEEIFNFYMKHKAHINNWDLVDLSAPGIAGAHLIDKDLNILFNLADSESLWDRRISVISTFYFIKNGIFPPTLQLCEVLLHDKEDLIHKAAGWMLREIGKRDIEVEEEFLESHCRSMPRTMLRYAIEKFPEAKRLSYLHTKSKI